MMKDGQAGDNSLSPRFLVKHATGTARLKLEIMKIFHEKYLNT